MVMQFAAKAQEAHSQFAVPVVSANSGGLVVRSQYFRGKVTHRFGQGMQYFRCNIACCKCSALRINAQLQAVTLCIKPH